MIELKEKAQIGESLESKSMKAEQEDKPNFIFVHT